jgi:thiamine pyrophosphate-dependent acetolactate synthase large subunit-like protein
MTVAEYILKFLVSKKVSDVFLITGGAISFVVDEFSRNKNLEINFEYTYKKSKQSNNSSSLKKIPTS